MPAREAWTQDDTEMRFFARFHARPDEEVLAGALREVPEPTRAEPGCLSIDVFRSTRDPRLFYTHSRWRDKAAFDLRRLAAHHSLR